MSQQSQFSDIIPDVEKFMEDHGLKDDVGRIMHENNVHLVNDDGEEKYKSIPSDLYQSSDFTYLPPTAPFPPDQPTNLGTEEYPGPFKFEVLIIPNEQKSPWEYSEKLNKIFIGINLKFPVAFSLQNRPQDLPLYIRATPVFSQTQHFQDLVHRCVGHRHPQDQSNKGVAPHIFQHIMRCSNENAQYFGDKNNGSRLNIVVPLAHPQVGEDIVKEFFQFVCKNSCPLGMNRRPIDVVFTLEDENGEVFGRRLVGVRVCSCPKRDKEKEEKDVENVAPPRRKKRKLEDEGRRVVPQGGNSDNKIFTLNVNIVGKNNYLHALKMCQDMMANEILKRQEQGNGDDSASRNCYNEITIMLNRMSN
ncbi:cellular tumor antigen p53-like isoform X2 [Tribolium madens]|uniref:cellular tumor antigen p53-like isoform X2 n=1 Tax=Tribolium madens TaxID=41895 RepID=UPI001CF73A78|nr:cellular tumor antigen p53-like isoform X2 [Tribolium madens]